MEQISRRTLLVALGALGSTGGLAACSDDQPSSATVDESATRYVDGADPTDQGSSTSTGGDSPSSGSTGGLRPVKLAAPEELRDRWAAYAAMWIGAAVSEGGTGPRAEGGDWVYEMETGQWAHLVRFKNGRAVLAGQSNPDISRSASAEKDVRARLLAAGPTWWGVIEEVLPQRATLGFVMGWDGKTWSRAANAPTEGGFDALTFYVKNDEGIGQQLATWGSEGKKQYSGSAKAPADVVIKAGTRVSVSQLKRLGPGMQAPRLRMAVKAARAFEVKGTH